MFSSNAGCGLVKEFLVALRNCQNSFGTYDNFCDNTTTLAVAKDPKYHEKTKHIKKRCHYIRDVIIENDVVLKHISTSNMAVDPLTKPIAMDLLNM